MTRSRRRHTGATRPSAVPSPPCDDRTRPTASARFSTTCTRTRRSRSTITTRTPCSSPWRCRPRPPTRRSTRSRRRCSPRPTRPEQMSALGPERILAHIREVGLAPTKARNLWTAANQIIDAGGEVVPDWDFLESLAGRRAQDGERRDVTGLRRAGVPGRHPHPSARPPLGPVRRRQRRDAPSATSRRCSRPTRGTAATCRSSTSAASTARRSATTSTAVPDLLVRHVEAPDRCRAPATPARTASAAP